MRNHSRVCVLKIWFLTHTHHRTRTTAHARRSSGRIISVAFDLYLSGWFGEGEPASHYAVKILRSLKSAAVGSKPVSACSTLPLPSVNGR